MILITSHFAQCTYLLHVNMHIYSLYTELSLGQNPYIYIINPGLAHVGVICAIAEQNYFVFK
jgi:hypothetical protein